MLDRDVAIRLASVLRHAASALENAIATQAALSEQLSKVLPDTVRTLGLSCRSRKALARLGIKTIDELCDKTMDELLAQKNFGVTCLAEVRDALESRGRSLKGDADLVRK